MHHAVNAFDVKSAGCYIRCYDCMASAFCEIFNRLRTLLLRHSTMYAGNTQALIFHLICDSFNACTGSAEYESSTGFTNRFGTNSTLH